MTERQATVEAVAKATTLVEALPYIRTYRGSTVVVKVGGAALDDPATAAGVADDIALLTLVGVKVVVVHGGGPQVTAAMKDAGLEAEFVGGLRVTSDDAMEIVRRVLVGSINADLVSRLSSAGLSAVGLSGADGGILQARRTAGPGGEDLGCVGTLESVGTDLLTTLMEGGHTPVLASVAVDAEDKPLNVNADEVAGTVAAALGAAKVVYLTNVSGLYSDFGNKGTLVSELKASELGSMIEELSEGMRPKALSAMNALTNGVGKAHILDGRIEHSLLLEIFTADGIGTQVLP